MPAGYSGTPLAKKLGVKPHSALALLDAHENDTSISDDDEDAMVNLALRRADGSLRASEPMMSRHAWNTKPSPLCDSDLGIIGSGSRGGADSNTDSAARTLSDFG